MSKVLITGAAGLLGKDVWEQFSLAHEVHALGRTQPLWVPQTQWQYCDLTDTAAVYKTVTHLNPDCVVHCAAFNNVDLAQTDPDQAYRGNALATRNLALACQRFDAVLMSVSTDYVFDGTDAPVEGYREFDPTHPISHYGESKRWAEIHVQDLLNKFFIVRTSWLFGPGRSTWVDRVVELARDGKPVPAVTDMISAPTYTPDLAAAMRQLAESHRYGLYHLTNEGFCSRAELADEICRIYKLPTKTLRRMTLRELNLSAPRPSFSGLANVAWRLEGFTSLRSWKEALNNHFTMKAKVPL